MVSLGRKAAVRLPRSSHVVAANEWGSRRYTGYHDTGEIIHEEPGWTGISP
jgi:hypothetical protein